MKQKLTLGIMLLLLGAHSFSQKFAYEVKPSLLGFHYSLVDYNSPTLIKNTSLSSTFKQGDIFRPKKQSTAFTFSYWKGLNKNVDYSFTYNGIFYDYVAHNDPSAPQHNNEFGSELEGTLNLHLNDAHLFTPFLTAGVGGGYYTNKFGGYVPLGIGFQFNFRSQTYIFLQTQYRVSLSKDVFPNNLFHSLGIAVNISGNKPAAPVKMPIVEAVVKDRD